jgi:hypothetical protein
MPKRVNEKYRTCWRIIGRGGNTIFEGGGMVLDYYIDPCYNGGSV